MTAMVSKMLHTCQEQNQLEQRHAAISRRYKMTLYFVRSAFSCTKDLRTFIQLLVEIGQFNQVEIFRARTESVRDVVKSKEGHKRQFLTS
jgi:hypothetical protein